MTNHEEEFMALQDLAEALVAAYRRGLHNGGIEWSDLDRIHARACQILGKRNVEIVHHEVDEEFLGV